MDKNTKPKRKLEVTKDDSNASELLKKRKEKLEFYDTNERLAKLRELSGVTKEDCFYDLLDKYLKGSTIPELVKEFNYNEIKIREMIDQHHKELSNARAANALIITSKEGFNPVLEKLKQIEVINDDFLDKLSPPTSSTLSEEESLFCWIYVHKGDSQEAIEMSTLDTGLFKDVPVTYRRGIFSRSNYLLNKENVASYIKELREQKYIAEDVTKTSIQQMLLEQIDQVKQRGDKKDAVHLRNLIELLGRTIGAFTDKVEVTEVNPSRSLDLLIEMAKEASVKELPN